MNDSACDQPWFTAALVSELVPAVGGIISLIIPDCAGACLGACALLARTLADHGVRTVAVRGEYAGRAHWWLELPLGVGGLRLDATRRQFDGGEELSDIADGAPYRAIERCPARWSDMQALAEFARMYEYPASGQAHALRIRAELKMLTDITLERLCSAHVREDAPARV